MPEYGVTKAELISHTRMWFLEAVTADPYGTEAVIRACFDGRTEFVWDLASVPQLTALRRGLLCILLAARA